MFAFLAVGLPVQQAVGGIGVDAEGVVESRMAFGEGDSHQQRIAGVEVAGDGDGAAEEKHVVRLGFQKGGDIRRDTVFK